MNKSIDSFYILKSFCAFLVVFLHLPNILGEAILLQPLCRLGVPCFLMISGYFLYKESGGASEAIVKQIKKLVWVIIEVNVVYMLFSVFSNFMQGKTIIPATWQTWQYWVTMFILGDSNDSVLWYLNAYIEALLILTVLIRYIYLGGKTILRTSICLLLLSVLFNRYSFLFGKTFDIHISRNALTVALPCIIIGAVLHKNLHRINKKKSLIGFVVCLILSYLEYGLLHVFDIDGSGADYNLLTYPFATSVLSLCIAYRDWKTTKIFKPFVWIGRYCSTNIYLYHSLSYHVLLLIGLYITINIVYNAEAVIGVIVFINALYILLRNKIFIRSINKLN